VLIFAAVVLVIGVALLQVNQFSRLTSTGYQINELNRERAARQAENHGLEADVASLSSLARVDWEARTRLHMEPPQQKLYIDVNHPLPGRQMLPTRFLPQEKPEAAQAQAGGESLWKRLLKLLPFF
jgi:cell division protein FtsL